MKPLRLLTPLLLLAAACATLGGSGGGGGDSRNSLWTQAFHAYSMDSVTVARALFQRLAAEYPRTHEGHEARYFMGVLSLDPRGGVDLRGAEEHFAMYLADDSIRTLQGAYRREATSLRYLVHEMRNPCGARTPGLGCDTATVSRILPVPETNPAANAAAAAEIARLRRVNQERGDTIRDLRAELERIRNTLAPRRP